MKVVTYREQTRQGKRSMRLSEHDFLYYFETESNNFITNKKRKFKQIFKYLRSLSFVICSAILIN